MNLFIYLFFLLIILSCMLTLYVCCFRRGIMRGCSRVGCDLGFWLFELRLMEMCAIRVKTEFFKYIFWNINKVEWHHPTQSLLISYPRCIHLEKGIKLLNLVCGMIWPAVLKCLAEILPKEGRFLFLFLSSLCCQLGWAVLCERVLQAWLLVLGTCGERREQRKSNGRQPNLPLGVYGPHQFEMSAWLEKLHKALLQTPFSSVKWFGQNQPPASLG